MEFYMPDNFRVLVIESEDRLRLAQLHSDVATLDALVSPDLLFTGHVGQIVTKADDLAFHRARLLRLEISEALEQHIQLHADFAVVSTLMHLVGTFEGNPIDQQLRYTRVWAFSPNGSLQVVAGHMSEVKPG
jgi:hypothetical protein